MRRALLVLLLSFAAAANGNSTITPIDAANHVGETATVCGTVASAKYAARSRGSPTFLNLDRAYPKQVFTAVIWGDTRPRFSSPPESMQGAASCVTGFITLYRGKPEILVRDPSAITAQTR